MPLKESEKEILEIIARFTFLSSLKDTGNLKEDKFREIMGEFGYRNQELIQYYFEYLNQHLGETIEFLDSIGGEK